MLIKDGGKTIELIIGDKEEFRFSSGEVSRAGVFPDQIIVKQQKNSYSDESDETEKRVYIFSHIVDE